VNAAGGFECLPDEAGNPGNGGQTGSDCRNDGRGCNAGFECTTNAAGTFECLPNDGGGAGSDCRNDGRGCNSGFRCATNAAGQFECLPTDPGGNGGGHPPVDHVRVDNPFVGAQFYLSPEYLANVENSQANAPANLRGAFEVLKRQPTAVWLDRIATIAGTEDRMGLRAHLDAALAQQAASNNPEQPMLITIVVYDLPDRDCAAFASNGELRLENGGLQTYKSDYIDAIAETLNSDPAYGALRVVTIIEPDSLPNIVTNLEIYEACAVAENAYREGVAYAVSEIAESDNAYIYLDIAHSGWLGWEHTETAAALYQEVLDAAGGADKVRGFATNTANYSSLQEHFNPFDDVNANMGLIEGFFEWNRVIDEVHFVDALREFFPNHGFIIDTSRNGWSRRGAEAPIDARTHRGNWCNQTGAGIGERPRANPRPGVDAYFWIKPPGESDGTSDANENSPNDEGKQYDEMCGQDDTVRPYSPDDSIPTGALPNAPHAGHWFHEQLVMLVENATPPLR
jgi:cellulose 1,4-beta-cellobiosidase